MAAEHKTTSVLGDYFFRYKWTTFLSMYVSYMCLILNRKSFSFVLPFVLKEGVLRKEDLGLITSSQNVAYTISKFAGGVLSDKLDAKLMLIGGLFLTSLCTVLFTAFDNAPLFAAVWFLQGLVQGGIWPACAKILREWCDADEFGTLWSFLSSAMNVAASIGPILVALLLASSTWRNAMLVIGSGAMIASLICALTVTRTPAEVGLHKDSAASKYKLKASGRGSWKDFLRSPFMIVISLGYMVTYCARTAALDWGQLFLIQELYQTPYMGSLFISCSEVGGLIGALLAGYTADKLMAAAKSDPAQGPGSPRMMVINVYSFIAVGALHLLLCNVEPSTPQVYISLIAFFFGFGLYGCMALYGVCAVEAAPEHLSGTAGAFVALFANIGAVFAGLPFSLLAEQWNWRGAFFLVELLMLVVLVIKLCGRNLASTITAEEKSD